MNFDFCYLERPVVGTLTKALSGNLTLCRLVLSNNNLGEESTLPLVKALENNLTTLELDLSANLLEDTFASALAETLKKN